MYSQNIMIEYFKNNQKQAIESGSAYCMHRQGLKSQEDNTVTIH